MATGWSEEYNLRSHNPSPTPSSYRRPRQRIETFSHPVLTWNFRKPGILTPSQSHSQTNTLIHILILKFKKLNIKLLT